MGRIQTKLLLKLVLHFIKNSIRLFLLRRHRLPLSAPQRIHVSCWRIAVFQFRRQVWTQKGSLLSIYRLRLVVLNEINKKRVFIMRQCTSRIHVFSLFLQPFLKQCRFLLAYHDILVITSFQSYYEFGTEVKTDFPDALNVGDILSIETEETGRV